MSLNGKISDLPDALCRFKDILTWSTYQRDAPILVRWQCPIRHFEAVVIDQVLARHGPEHLIIDFQNGRGCLLSVWALADLILESHCRTALPDEANEAPHHFAPLGGTIHAVWDHHCYYAEVAEKNVLREREEHQRRRQIPDVPPAVELPVTAVRSGKNEQRHQLTDPAVLQIAKDKLIGCNADMKLRAEALNRLFNTIVRTLPGVGRSQLKCLDALERDFPHFGAVLESIRLQLRLQQATGSPLVLRPLLMVGPPGVGKTAFMRRLGEGLNLALATVSAGTVSASWILRGGSSSWKNASMGIVASGILRLKPSQGLLLLIDELDKMQDDGRNHPLEPALLELLEPEQNRHFEDEYLGVPMNIQPLLSVVATANRLGPISPPLRSRLTNNPTTEQMPAVLRSVDRELRREEPGLGSVFHPLSDEVLGALGSVSLREARGTLLRAYGKALERTTVRGRRALVAGDIQAAKPVQTVAKDLPQRPPDPVSELVDLLKYILAPPLRGAPPGTVLH